MTEEAEQTTQPAGQESTPPKSQDTGPVTETKPTAPSWSDLLADVSADDLRKHPRISGMLGEMAQRARDQAEREIKEKNRQEAAEKAEQEVLALAREDPEKFAERFISDHERDKIRKEVEGSRAQAIEKVAKAVGAAVTALPEWAELTQEEYLKLVQAVQDKNEEEAISAYNRAALDIFTERRAARKLADWRDKELAKEREAIRAEERASHAASRPAPSLRQGTPKGAVDVDSMNDKEFDAFWQQFRRSLQR